ncbi:MAG: hypothetical protein JNJ59_13200 [Deltaproteobacteria bacterium]|nr:hypothetical protein [Deltaproteobacteria bacterium]
MIAAQIAMMRCEVPYRRSGTAEPALVEAARAQIACVVASARRAELESRLASLEGFVAWRRGETALAESHLVNALAASRRAGGDFLAECGAELGLAMLFLDAQRPDEADGALRRARAYPHIELDGYQRAFIAGALAQSQHDRGALDEAERGFDEAIALAAQGGFLNMQAHWLANQVLIALDRGARDLAHARARACLEVALTTENALVQRVAHQVVGAAACARGLRDEARAAFAAARVIAPESKTGGEVLEVLLALADLEARAERPRRAELEALRTSALTHDEPIRAARACLRIVLDHVDRALAPLRARAVLTVDAKGFRLAGDDYVDLGRKPVLRRLLLALVAEPMAPGAGDSPLRGVSAAALIDRTWPDEKILEHAARARLHVAVSSLRQLGLTEVLLRTDDGYVLDCEVCRA